MSTEEKKHAEKSQREELVHVAIVESGRHSQVVAMYPENTVEGASDPTYRAVFPVEMCEHYHASMGEAIACGAPRILAFTAIMHSIGKSMREQLAQRGEENDAGQ